MNVDLLEVVASQWEKGFLRQRSQYGLYIFKTTHRRNNYAFK